MADNATLARPYARAAFEYARAADALEPWRDFFDRLAQLVALQPVRDLITSPEAERDERAALIAELAGEPRPEGAANLLKLMAENGRLEVIPAVAAEFGRLATEAETTIDVTIETAEKLGEDSSERLVAALGKRFGRRIEASFEVVPAIIGGVVMRIGDHVIDASLATRLRRLAKTMTG
ncbi:MAG: F0F1 ATP synthase subunit delta [Gammaproteobacteria bacterium]